MEINVEETAPRMRARVPIFVIALKDRSRPNPAMAAVMIQLSKVIRPAGLKDSQKIRPGYKQKKKAYRLSEELNVLRPQREAKNRRPRRIAGNRTVIFSKLQIMMFFILSIFLQRYYR
ncbi:hypothetical protein [Thermoanaerobacterium sp. DL9XJH110]|uniref:hypothetical protein n=1 Tax=Thermoanaerobacterium sp. DL9XJH110 TaxID=3386643 RepID=UPI003BB63D2C